MCYPLRPFLLSCFLFLPALAVSLQAETALSGDYRVEAQGAETGHLTLDGGLSIGGNAMDFGTTAASDSALAWTYTENGTTYTVTVSATRASTAFLWQDNAGGTAKTKMKLGGNNVLVLQAPDYTSGSGGQIILTPATGGSQITVDGNALLTQASAASTYLTSTGAENAYLRKDATQVALGSSLVGGNFSTAMGYSGTGPDVEGATAMGYSYAGDHNATAMGSSVANGTSSTAMGNSSATHPCSTALGASTAGNEYSTAVGFSIAEGVGAMAAGYGSTASGDYSTALGVSTASGYAATAMGTDSYASGIASTAMGAFVYANGNYSTAMGSSTASGDFSTAMGQSYAHGDYSTSMGNSTTAQAWSSVAMGQYNVGAGTVDEWVATDPLLEVGNGHDDGGGAVPSNALTLFKNANLRTGGVVEAKAGFRTPPKGDLSMGEFTEGANPADLDPTLGLKYQGE